mmetsp:Transcript_125951/g.317651  ORF Transcript_125951/g.317651 Transcript_125951/m.317651 type:complete len:214 (-) Transcript_125951:489-1130(-)
MLPRVSWQSFGLPRQSRQYRLARGHELCVPLRLHRGGYNPSLRRALGLFQESLERHGFLCCVRGFRGLSLPRFRERQLSAGVPHHASYAGCEGGADHPGAVHVVDRPCKLHEGDLLRHSAPWDDARSLVHSTCGVLAPGKRHDPVRRMLALPEGVLFSLAVDVDIVADSRRRGQLGLDRCPAHRGGAVDRPSSYCSACLCVPRCDEPHSCCHR